MDTDLIWPVCWQTCQQTASKQNTPKPHHTSHPKYFRTTARRRGPRAAAGAPGPTPAGREAEGGGSAPVA